MLDFVDLNNAYIWALLGATLICIEMILGWSVIVLFVIGISSITVSIVLLSGASRGIPPLAYQIAVLVGSCCVWSMICWKWLKMQYKANVSKQYHGIIGQTAEVYEENMIIGETGKIKWSGTVCKARIDEERANNSKELKKGSIVTITDIKNNTFFIKPHNIEES